MRITSARSLNAQGIPARGLVAGQPATFEFTYRNLKNVKRGHLAVTVFNHLGDAATHLDTWFYDAHPIELSDQGMFTCRIPNLPFPPGEYRLSVSMNPDHGGNADIIPNALIFTVENSVFFPSMNTPSIHSCSVMVQQEWEHQTSDGTIEPIRDAAHIAPVPSQLNRDLVAS